MTDENAIEAAMAIAHRGESDTRPVLAAFMNGRVIAPSAPGLKDLENGFQPLVLSSPDALGGYMGLFTSIERAQVFLGPNPDHLFAEMNGSDVVRGIDPTLGLLINPGSETGMQVSPEIVAALRNSLTG